MNYNQHQLNAIGIAGNVYSFSIINDVYKTSLDFYNNGLDKNALNYLRKIGKNVLPAKQRRIDRLTPRLRYLKSREAVRRIPISIKLADSTSISEKIKKINEIANKEYIDSLQKMLEDIVPEFAQIDDINLNVNKYIEELSTKYAQQGYNEEEVRVMAINIISKQLKMLMEEATRKSMYIINKNKGFKELRSKIVNKVQQDYVDELERKIDILLRSNMLKRDFDHEKQIAFENSLKTAIGAEYYYVDITADSNEPTFEALSPLDVVYPATSNTWVQDGDWVIIKRRFTARQLDEHFKLTGKAKEIIDKYEGKRNGNAFIEGGYSYPSATDELSSYEVYHEFFIEEEKRIFAFYPNKYNSDSPHIHMIEESEKAKLVKKGIKIKELPFYVLYEAVMYNGMFLVEPRKISDVVRYEESYRRPKLPVVGLVFDNNLRKPYSLVLETKDSYELSAIINLKLEMIVTLSGVKGMIMDDSQRPSNMSREEWSFLKKQGTAWIQSMKNGRPASFNQFQAFDDTIPPSIEVLLRIDDSIERHYELVTGVTRQSLAMMEQYDLKGTTMAAINQTLSIVESIYQTHEMIYVKALEHYVNLLTKYSEAKNVTVDYEDSKMGYVAEKIDLSEYEERSIRIMLNKSINDENVKELYKQLSIQGVLQNKLPIKAISAILTSDSFREMDMRLSSLIEEYDKKVNEYQMNIDNNKAENEGRLIQLKGEIEKVLKEYDIKVQEMKLQQESERINADYEIRYRELESKENNDGMNYKVKTEANELKNKDIDTEKFIEMAYLKEQQRQSIVNSQLETIRLKLDAILKNTSQGKNTKVTGGKEHIKD